MMCAYRTDTCGTGNGKTAARQMPVLRNDQKAVRLDPAAMERVAINFRRLSGEAASHGKAGQERSRTKADIGLAAAVLMLAIGTVWASPVVARSLPIACGAIHTVEGGDTLFKIAKRAYGDGKLYENIFVANTDLLPDTASVEIGDQLLIPCLDGSRPRTRSDAIALGLLAAPGTDEPGLAAPPAQSDAVVEEPIRTPTSVSTETVGALAKNVAVPSPGRAAALAVQLVSGTDQALGAASEEPFSAGTNIRFLTGSGLAPYAHKDLPEGGLITDLVRRAMWAGASGRDSPIFFINNRPVHLNFLLPSGAFDIGFPWYKPECSDTGNLGEEAEMLCAAFDFSDAFLEVPVGYYVRARDPLMTATSHSALYGKKLCRPAGHFTFDLDQNGLTSTNLLIDLRGTADACFAKLARGEVDVVTLTRPDTGASTRQPIALGEVVEIEALATRQTLHAIASKANPNRRAHLDMVNRGLAALMASGEWFRVVNFHNGRRLAVID